MPNTAIFDVDGTLVDDNYQHALAWFRAFRRFDITRPLWQLHRGIGMGGDHFVSALAGEQVERTWGDELRAAWSEEFEAMIEEIQPLDGAHDLLVDVKRRGLRLVLASSGQRAHVEHLLGLIDGKQIADAWTTSEDADRSKPDPDLVQVALAKVGGARGVVVGDSTWDAIAARRAGLPMIAVRTGGYSEQELRAEGAIEVFGSIVDLRHGLDASPLRGPD